VQLDPIEPKLRLPGTKHLKLKHDELLSNLDPMKLTLKAPGSKHLKLEYDELLSNVAFNFNLRRCSKGAGDAVEALLEVGQCRLTLSNPG
jgi:hypothetical protein